MIFLDSNVWFYGYTKTGDEMKREKAQYLAQKSDLCLSSQVINEVVSNLIRKANAPEDYVRTLVQLFYSTYLVLEILQEDIFLASELREEYRLSYWDSLVVASALRANAQTLYSEDMQDGLVIRNRLTIRNPFK